eukprot:TRINITY_DN944_c0_g1_i1.p1 TRINITY_DN944_c0_g1~~TRINITY_DN944_c0_g1_i1.p1  ORF type:complete len:242 (+),score=19.78 TRINITY_DN944_c0_g1_i1:100-825(+)
MKNLYPKSKGKIYPSPPSSSSSPNKPTTLSVLNLLPAAILVLTTVLALEDREALAYFITCSLKPPSSTIGEKKKCKKPNNVHKPLFDCECFDCYTSFWYRWDTSPNRELISQAIEAFEEHLASTELCKKTGKGGRKKDRRFSEKPAGKPVSEEPKEPFPVMLEKSLEEENQAFDETGDATSDTEASGCYDDDEGLTGNRTVDEIMAVQLPASNNQGLVRKIWPDVLGLFNSRVWSLWSPNV